MSDQMKIADRTFDSRLIVGTSRYPDLHTMLEAVEESGASMVTVSIRRLDLNDITGENPISLLRKRHFVLPNTDRLNYYIFLTHGIHYINCPTGRKGESAEVPSGCK